MICSRCQICKRRNFDLFLVDGECVCSYCMKIESLDKNREKFIISLFLFFLEKRKVVLMNVVCACKSFLFGRKHRRR